MLAGNPEPGQQLPSRYSAPTRMEEAVALLRSEEGARLIAGGQHVIPSLQSNDITATHLVDTRNIAELRRLDITPDAIFIGANQTFSSLLQGPVAARLPALADALRYVGTGPIRNRATLGGNLAWANPRAEVPVVLMAYEAMIHTDRRTIPMAELPIGSFKTSLQRDEILVGATVPTSPDTADIRFLELLDRHSAGRAVASVAVRPVKDGVRIVVGGVFDRPVTAICAPDRMDEALTDMADTHPSLFDPFHSVDYRYAMAAVLLRRALTAGQPLEGSETNDLAKQPPLAIAVADAAAFRRAAWSEDGADLR